MDPERDVPFTGGGPTRVSSRDERHTLSVTHGPHRVPANLAVPGGTAKSVDVTVNHSRPTVPVVPSPSP